MVLGTGTDPDWPPANRQRPTAPELRFAFKEIATLDLLLSFPAGRALLVPFTGPQAQWLAAKRSSRIRTAINAQLTARAVLASLPRSETGSGRLWEVAWAFDLELPAAGPNVFAAHIRANIDGQSLTSAEAWHAATLLQLSQLVRMSAAVRRSVLAPDVGADVREAWRSLASIDEAFQGIVAASLYPFEQELEHDPAAVYSAMNWRTKQVYRDRLDSKAEAAGEPRQHLASAITKGSSHNGCLLFLGPDTDNGDRAQSLTRAQRKLLAFSLLASFAVSVVLAALIVHDRVAIALLLVFSLAFVVVSQAIDAITETIAPLLFPPRPVFSMAAQDTRPDVTTIIAIPIILRDPSDFLRILEATQRRCADLPPRRMAVCFLSDWSEAAHPGPTSDEVSALTTACAAVRQANADPRQHLSIVLLHRERSFSNEQGSWLGHGRKVGKLIDLFRLITVASSPFSHVEGPADTLVGATFVITLDDDTHFDGRSLLNLEAVASHPLNAPFIDPGKGVVSRGFGVITPLTGSYARAAFSVLGAVFDLRPAPLAEQLPVSDPLFTIWGERQHSGKAIYNVRVANEILSAHLDPETCLSHDIIEGGLLRTGYCSDALACDLAPASFSAASVRRERWCRGDIQNIFALAFRETRWRRHISNFGKILILRNARTTLVPLAQLLLITGCMIAPATLLRKEATLLAAALPIVFSYLAFGPAWIASIVCNGPFYRLAYWLHRFAKLHVAEFVWLAMLPHRASISLFAALLATLRSLRRSRRSTWVPSHDAERTAGFARLHGAVLLSLSVAALFVFLVRLVNGDDVDATSAILLTWSAAPVLVWLAKTRFRVGL